MKLTANDVYRIEHDLINGLLIWDAAGDTETMKSVLMHIAGLNEMTVAVVAAIEDD